MKRLATALIACLAALAAPSVASAAGLSMTGFSPASGPVGTVVTITGTGFISGDIVSFNGTQASGSTANSAGTKLKASVPVFATGGPILVTDPPTGQTVGLPGTAFQVTKGLFLSSRHVWAGGSLIIDGSALSGNTADPILLGRVQVGLAQTDAAGDFHTTVSIPWNQRSGKSSVSVIDALLGAIGTVIFINGNWPQFGHDAAHSNFDTYEPALSPKSVPGLKVKWTHYTAQVTPLPSAAVGGFVFADYGNSDPVAFDSVAGAAIWTSAYPFSFLVLGGPLSEDNGLVIASGQGCFYNGCDCPAVVALNASSGAFVWATCTGNVETAAAVSNGVVYVGSDDNHVYALRESDGATLWTYATGAPVRSTPAVAGGVVYFGSDDFTLYAVNATTGTLLWSGTTSAALETAPSVAKGVVYVGAGDGNLYALNATTGSVNWTFHTGTPVTSPAVANGVVYVGSGNSTYALNAVNGSVMWTFSAPGIPTTAAIANGVAYVGYTATTLPSFDEVYALNIATGGAVWSYTLGDPVGQPIVSGGMVYVPTESNSGLLNGLTAFGL